MLRGSRVGSKSTSKVRQMIDEVQWSKATDAAARTGLVECARRGVEKQRGGGDPSECFASHVGDLALLTQAGCGQGSTRQRQTAARGAEDCETKCQNSRAPAHGHPDTGTAVRWFSAAEGPPRRPSSSIALEHRLQASAELSALQLLSNVQTLARLLCALAPVLTARPRLCLCDRFQNTTRHREDIHSTQIPIRVGGRPTVAIASRRSV